MLYRPRAVQRHSARLANGDELEGLPAITPDERTMFDATSVRLPTMKRLDDAA